MRKILAATVLVLASLSGQALAQNRAPTLVLLQNLRWFIPPNNAALRSAWVLGADQKPGAYLLRVKLASRGKIPLHTHPNERNSTVLSGTIYVGFGEVFDESKVVAIPTGVYVASANKPHYIWDKDGEAMYQYPGIGPTATVPVN